MVKYSSDPALVYKRITQAWKKAGIKNAKQYVEIVSEKCVEDPSIASLTQGTTTGWKNGSMPSTTQLITICNVCGCDLEYLLGGDTFKAENQDIHDITGLPEEAIEGLRELKRARDEKREHIKEDLDIKCDDKSIEYTDPTEWLYSLITFIATNPLALGRLVSIAKRTTKYNIDYLGLCTLPKPIRRAAENAYKMAAEDAKVVESFQHSSTFPKAFRLNYSFRDYLRDNMKQNEEAIKKCLPPENPEIDFGYIVAAVSNRFRTFDSVLNEDEAEMRRYHIMQDFMYIVNLFQEESEKQMDSYTKSVYTLRKEAVELETEDYIIATTSDHIDWDNLSPDSREEKMEFYKNMIEKGQWPMK